MCARTPLAALSAFQRGCAPTCKAPGAVARGPAVQAASTRLNLLLGPRMLSQHVPHLGRLSRLPPAVDVVYADGSRGRLQWAITFAGRTVSAARLQVRVPAGGCWLDIWYDRHLGLQPPRQMQIPPHTQAVQRAANTAGIPARALQAAIDVVKRKTANISALSDLVRGRPGDLLGRLLPLLLLHPCLPFLSFRFFRFFPPRALFCATSCALGAHRPAPPSVVRAGMALHTPCLTLPREPARRARSSTHTEEGCCHRSTLQVSESNRRKAAEALPSPTRRALQATNATSAVLNVQLNYINDETTDCACRLGSPLARWGSTASWQGTTDEQAGGVQLELPCTLAERSIACTG